MIKRLIAFFRAVKNARRVARIRARGNVVEVAFRDLSRVKLKVSGEGNVIRIGRLSPGNGRLTVAAFSADSRIEIAPGLSISRNLSINIGQNHPNFGRVLDCSVDIGTETSMEEVGIGILNSHAHVRIGSHCMFSYEVTLYQTDAHPIYEHGTDRIVNRVGTMAVGEHVWIGARSTLLKNTVIADGSLVGWGSVVSGRFTEPNSVIVGNPARQLPGRKIDWRSSDSRYLQNC